MSKKIVHILLPVLAIILSIVNCQEYVAAHSSAASGYSIFVAHQYSHSVSLEKQTHHKDKNAIRIKARDDASAMAFSTIWQPVVSVSYYTRPFYCNYNSPTLSIRFSRYNLRGPPTA